MLDGAVSMMAMFMGFRAMGMFDEAPGASLLGGAAHFYDTYATADGKFVAVAPLEPEFYGEFLDRVGLDRDRFLPHGFRFGRMDDSRWDELKAELAAMFKTRSRDEWCALLEGTDACFAPVLALSEAPAHPHNEARGTFVEIDGVVQNAPAPRFSRSVPGFPDGPRVQGADTRVVLQQVGYDNDALAALAAAGVIPERKE
jgi:alpha-methylacyl-CoA racemase